jgi:ribosomal protein S1
VWCTSCAHQTIRLPEQEERFSNDGAKIALELKIKRGQARGGSVNKITGFPVFVKIKNLHKKSLEPSP